MTQEVSIVAGGFGELKEIWSAFRTGKLQPAELYGLQPNYELFPEGPHEGDTDHFPSGETVK